jgi:cysteine desulfurase / selenocysteine lyase
MLDPDKIRSFYPGLGGRTYFDAASLGVASTRSLEAVRSMAEGVSRLEAPTTRDRHIELGRLRHGARAALARYLNAPPESIALVENTTQGLSLVAATVPLQAGDNVVVGRSDYLQTVLPWQLRRERDGIELRFVEPRSDRLELDDVAACVNDRTRVVCLSSV